MRRSFCVYIMANLRRTLYVGITSNLPRRLAQHASGTGSRFVERYDLKRLVHVEVFARPDEAIAREKQLKGWLRRRKIELIDAANPGWNDLSAEWGWRAPLDSAGRGRSMGRFEAKNET